MLKSWLTASGVVIFDTKMKEINEKTKEETDRNNE